ncbi:WD40 repeat domain-containing protein [Pelagicoccus sp. SDUM812002]|uniref:WD40 repeat domain-containing protein n=1 Tax=Pelagicoccus sp. SDUM812002 TaxID=3041266 RepID=UPI002810913F|nr:WD40 repeat domain-containing protein [Pelagicoccus sp. SDUM812002]MDQ8185795.1 WD40 repeat domain-containing protein [Pelagicoccus sp. SDUM812002]
MPRRQTFLAFQLSFAFLVASICGRPVQPLEDTILARTHTVIGEGFDSTSYRLLEGSILEIPAKASSPRFFTYIDLQDGRRVMRDIQERSALRIFNFDPAEDIAIVSDSVAEWRTIEASSGMALADLSLGGSPYQLVIASQGHRVVAFISNGTGLSLQALDPRSGQISWNKLLPTGSRAELSGDRTRLNVLRADPTYPNGRYLELYDPMDGALSASVDLAAELSDSQILIQAYSNDGLYAVLQRSTPSRRTLIDIRRNSIHDFHTNLLTEMSADSRFAIIKDSNEWHVIELENASTVHSISGGSLASPMFTGKPDQIVYYDANSHALRHVDLKNSETSLALQLPAELSNFSLSATSADGRFFALNDLAGSIHIFDTSTNSTTTIETELDGFSSFRIDTDSKRLIAAGVSGNISSMSLTSPNEFEVITQERVQRMVVSEAKNQLSVLFARGRVRRYDASSLELIDENVLRLPASDSIHALASDTPLIAYQASNAFKIANYETQEVVWTRPSTGASEGTIDAVLSASGRYIAIRSFDPFSSVFHYDFEVFDTSNSELVFEIDIDAQNLWQTTFSANEAVVSFGIRDPNESSKLITYQLSDGTLKSMSPSFQSFNGFALSADGSQAILTSGSSVISLDLTTGETTVIAEATDEGVQALAVNPSQSHAIVIEPDSQVHLIDLQSGERAASTSFASIRKSGHFNHGAEFLAFLPDSRGFLFSQNDGALKSWKILKASRSVALAAITSEGYPAAQFEVFKDRGYRLLKSADLFNWTSDDPFDGGTAPTDSLTQEPLLPSTQIFLEAWEYEQPTTNE